MNNKTVINIGGPTASGKTALAIQIAKHYSTAIISADSRQCYKELNIGVAKPSPAQLLSVPHYFVGTHSIHDQVTAATFEEYALAACDQLFKNHDIVVVAGGTGLYIKAFCEGLDVIPATPPAVRSALTDKFHTLGLQWLQEEVKLKDPAFWRVAEQQNPRRLLRALEVVETTGKSITLYRKGDIAERPFTVKKYALEIDRSDLYNRINQRVETMIAEGLVEEVQNLLPHQRLSALQTVGYKEMFNHLLGHSTLDEAVEQIKKNTRHYAKRQITWFKKDSEVQWLTPDNALSKITSLSHCKTKPIKT